MQAHSFRIVDDLLDEGAWSEVWSYVQFCELHPVTRTAGAWKLDDGTPLGGEEIVTPGRDEELGAPGAQAGRYPSGTALDRVLEAVLEVSSNMGDLVGSDWAHLTARPYVYPRGSGLSWHGDDSQVYDGAYIYYAHPHWNAHWGGELLIAETQTQGQEAIMGHRFADEDYSAHLMEDGLGHYVAPKPNRLVVLGSAPHMVSPVRAAAGSAVRASISGFFLSTPRP